MKCPFCKAIIDDDSWFCDQCGKELKFCPECRQPKRGTECAACGADLVSAEAFFTPKSEGQKPKEAQKESAPKPASPSFLEGEGLKLPLKEGVFGRTTGIYPEFSSQIYISGQHGELRCIDGQWQIRDLGSRNGTHLNGTKLMVNSWTDLHIGDILKIATTLLTVK
jgi:predicted component of type VI protein secretion system